MNQSAAIMVVLLVVGPGSAAVATGKPVPMRTASQCKIDERPIYSCLFGRKTGSLCLGQHSIHYRYGPLSRPEIDLGSTPDWSNVHHGMLYSNAFAQSHVRLTTGTTSYVIHAGETGNLSDQPGRRISGIVVFEGLTRPRELVSIDCKTPQRLDSDLYINGMSTAAPPNWGGSEEKDGPFDYYF